MERLTKRCNENAVTKRKCQTCIEHEDMLDGKCSSGCIADAINQLADYEDARLTPEQIKEMIKELTELKKQLLPCEVGDTVYWVNNHYRTFGDY